MHQNQGVIEALSRTRTSNQWTLLSGLVQRVNKTLTKDGKEVQVNAEQLCNLVKETEEYELTRLGIWREPAGRRDLMVCINPGFAEAYQKAASVGDFMECTCQKRTGEKKQGEPDIKRFFGSMDYNAGRHAPALSSHKPNCVCWRPPAASHLHSWRRGYQ